ncbi:MAG TPA: hypothetical protein VMS98_05315 [Thermoanaerobaculia bacterium]|nr:hypothetical protein [Thermoanaerobaculia bacterium]
MDSEFTVMLLIVIGSGAAIVGIGATLLFLAFRAWADPTQDRRRTILLGATIVFVFACCAGVFLLSFI